MTSLPSNLCANFDSVMIQLHTFTGSKYVSMDTLFSLVDAALYAHLVALKDNDPGVLAHKVNDVRD